MEITNQHLYVRQQRIEQSRRKLNSFIIIFHCCDKNERERDPGWTGWVKITSWRCDAIGTTCLSARHWLMILLIYVNNLMDQT